MVSAGDPGIPSYESAPVSFLRKQEPRIYASPLAGEAE